MRECPFRKRTIYSAGRNTGSGYPLEWITTEEFEECIGENCMAYYVAKHSFQTDKVAVCTLCNNYTID